MLVSAVASGVLQKKHSNAVGHFETTWALATCGVPGCILKANHLAPADPNVN